MSLLHLRLVAFLCSKKQKGMELLFHPLLFVSHRCVSTSLHTGI